jgi:hypothetical protein
MKLRIPYNVQFLDQLCKYQFLKQLGMKSENRIITVNRLVKNLQDARSVLLVFQKVVHLLQRSSISYPYQIITKIRLILM